MLVLAIGAVLSMSSWQLLQKFRQQREQTQALAAVHAVMMTAALHAHDQLSVEQLIEARFLRASKINNKLLSDFTLQYLDHPKRIVCNAKYKKTLNEQTVKSLHATINRDTQQLEWQTTPAAALQPISSFWMMQAPLQQYVKQVTLHAAS